MENVINVKQIGSNIHLYNLVSNTYGTLSLYYCKNIYIDKCQNINTIMIRSIKLLSELQIRNSSISEINFNSDLLIKSLLMSNCQMNKLRISTKTSKFIMDGCKFNSSRNSLNLEINSNDAEVTNCYFSNINMNVYRSINISNCLFTKSVSLYVYKYSTNRHSSMISNNTFRNIDIHRLFYFRNVDLEFTGNIFESCKVSVLFNVYNGHVTIQHNVFRKNSSSLVYYFIELQAGNYIATPAIDARFNYMQGLHFNPLSSYKARYLGCKYFYVDSKLGHIMLTPSSALESVESTEYVYYNSSNFVDLPNGGEVLNDTSITVSQDLTITKSILVARNVTMILNVEATLKFVRKTGIQVFGWYYKYSCITFPK